MLALNHNVGHGALPVNSRQAGKTPGPPPGRQETRCIQLLMSSRQRDKIALKQNPQKDCIIADDLNSHSPNWGYEDLDTRGEEVEEWQVNSLQKLIDMDVKTTFN
ncbi:hypothetical protein PoB_004290500 [Plakobranchus ocellatus]|uniref:Endonuclease/exonuclease/phosphatase domain-containing protein n=1 Tax=Plakobranchus ocellatus TaxID=259542 RepID=A0AAV4BA60_9GAST|nr:hypothetical protein PoB_004290500 [Plakobranchus ocellatus]